MLHTTMCGVDYSHYYTAQLEGVSLSRIDMHCRDCGALFGMIAVTKPLTEKSPHDIEKCECGCNSLVVDEVYVDGEPLQRHQSPYERKLARLLGS